jgi:hypothetical protein
VEHWVEKNMLKVFTQSVIEQKLPSGSTFKAAANVPPDFFTNFMNSAHINLASVLSVPGATMETVPAKRIMHTLGSDIHTANFMLLEATLNNMKKGVSTFLLPSL